MGNLKKKKKKDFYWNRIRKMKTKKIQSFAHCNKTLSKKIEIKLK